jgi:hypothetical protein
MSHERQRHERRVLDVIRTVGAMPRDDWSYGLIRACHHRAAKLTSETWS